MKKKKIICFDLDNTLCKMISNHYKKSRSIKKDISLLNKLYDKGFYIKFLLLGLWVEIMRMQIKQENKA